MGVKRVGHWPYHLDMHCNSTVKREFDLVQRRSPSVFGGCVCLPGSFLRRMQLMNNFMYDSRANCHTYELNCLM